MYIIFLILSANSVCFTSQAMYKFEGKHSNALKWGLIFCCCCIFFVFNFILSLYCSIQQGKLEGSEMIDWNWIRQKPLVPNWWILRVNIMHVILFKKLPAYSAVIHYFEVSYNKVAIMIFLLLLLISYGMLQCNESEIWQTICHLAFKSEGFLSLSSFKLTEQLLLADDFNTNKQLCLWSPYTDWIGCKECFSFIRICCLNSRK